MRPLLVLVDLQRDFLKSAAMEPDVNGVIQKAAWLLEFCRRKKIGVVHVRTQSTRDPDNRMPHWKQAGLWLCEEGTPGYESPPELSPRENEHVIHKSGFAAPDLAAHLRTANADLVLVAGVKTHACIRQAVLDAMQSGIPVRVAEDAVASDDPLHAAITRRYLEDRGVVFVPADVLMQGLADAANDEHDPCVAASAAIVPAVEAAHRCASEWRRTPLLERLNALDRLGRILEGRSQELSRLIAQEIGKPLRFCRLEVQRTVQALQAIGSRARSTAGGDEHSGTVVRRRPHGVVAVITPWNNPVYISLTKIGPAIAYGNTVVWKPAPEAQAISAYIATCLDEAGWMPGLVNVLQGGRHEAEALMRDPRISAVTLTGSCAAGRSAQAICASRNIPLQAELGGNNASIVWPDADLHHAAEQIAAGAFDMAGQRCTASRRVIVHQDCRDRFLQLLTEEAAALPWGDPLEADTRIGPLVTLTHCENVASAVERAVRNGSVSIRPLGEAPSPALAGDDRYYPPTILSCESPTDEIVQEETFGPVLVVQTARELEDALSLCNGARQGLAAAVFTGSSDVAQFFLDNAEAGILKVNQSTADAEIDMPFAGWKASGVGLPEHGEYDREFYTRPQTAYLSV